MKTAFTLIALVAGLTLAADNLKVDLDGKIRELQKERVAALREVAEVSIALHKSARLSYDELIQARLNLLNAELDASQTHQERVNANEKIVELWKEAEDSSGRNASPANAPRVMILKAKAARLKAEIELEREKIRS